MKTSDIEKLMGDNLFVLETGGTYRRDNPRRVRVLAVRQKRRTRSGFGYSNHADDGVLIEHVPTGDDTLEPGQHNRHGGPDLPWRFDHGNGRYLARPVNIAGVWNDAYEQEVRRGAERQRDIEQQRKDDAAARQRLSVRLIQLLDQAGVPEHAVERIAVQWVGGRGDTFRVPVDARWLIELLDQEGPRP